MKGYIKIESTAHEGKEGISIDTHLQDVSYMDRIAAVNGLCIALEITPTELKLMAGLLDSGFMDAFADTYRKDNAGKYSPETKKNHDFMVDLLRILAE